MLQIIEGNYMTIKKNHTTILYTTNYVLKNRIKSKDNQITTSKTTQKIEGTIIRQ